MNIKKEREISSYMDLTSVLNVQYIFDMGPKYLEIFKIYFEILPYICGT